MITSKFLFDLVCCVDSSWKAYSHRSGFDVKELYDYKRQTAYYHLTCNYDEDVESIAIYFNEDKSQVIDIEMYEWGAWVMIGVNARYRVNDLLRNYLMNQLP